MLKDGDTVWYNRAIDCKKMASICKLRGMRVKHRFEVGKVHKINNKEYDIVFIVRGQ